MLGLDLSEKHFHEKLESSYTEVKQALTGVGLVERRRRRGPHRRRRERRPLPGMLLHIDGSQHYGLNNANRAFGKTEGPVRNRIHFCPGDFGTYCGAGTDEDVGSDAQSQPGTCARIWRSGWVLPRAALSTELSAC